MARGMNHVFFVGALARDPELRYTPNGTPVCDLTIAGEDQVLGSDGQTRSLPWYHRVGLMGKPAETAAEQFKAGSAVAVEGSMEQRSWDDAASGQKRSMISIKALRVDGVSRPESDLVRDSGGGFRLQNALNEAVLVGNLGRKPELRYTPSGDAVVGFSIAVSESWKGRDGNWQEKTHWLDINAWRELAELVANLDKGDSVLVHGRIKNETWTDRDGQKRNSTKVEATRVEALTRGPAPSGAVGTTQPAAQKAYGNAGNAAKAAGTQSRSLDIDEGLDNFPPEEEDLPF
ncbi:single-stranded DNA-binding protein [Deinococcus cellulosilyticus]|uniref:Single-stranded DNA-binding protein n=1 Tax=Deinococcus cellulosilyticus (strain DSM 18568 / NBRC 106333 / KACC 11606 / 5516J-15) TaxID=1223518 RepID=A0A511N4F1_DEIC1|nr:single-stranded DNA-binding protein [Deinococcus cellulosilyticus]GEM47754.1 single-stranded DNA-binding protein [Deinococcus cellulosilyticus NBRC 106333 = KACC 11606]